MRDIPLTPAGGGGLCLANAAVQRADILVSAGTGPVSGVIKFATSSYVSHAALCIGNDQVVEAVGEGVRIRRIDASLNDHYLGVIYRVKGITPAQADRVVREATNFHGSYDALGAMGGGVHSSAIAQAVCVMAVGILPCLGAEAGGWKSSDRFYCSQLVLEAFKRAGASFIDARPNTSVPQDLVNAQSSGKLFYVGHLRTGEIFNTASAG